MILRDGVRVDGEVVRRIGGGDGRRVVWWLAGVWRERCGMGVAGV